MGCSNMVCRMQEHGSMTICCRLKRRNFTTTHSSCWSILWMNIHGTSWSSFYENMDRNEATPKRNEKQRFGSGILHRLQKTFKGQRNVITRFSEVVNAGTRFEVINHVQRLYRMTT